MCNEGCVTSQLVLLQRSVTRSVTNVRRGSVTDPSKKFTAIFFCAKQDQVTRFEIVFMNFEFSWKMRLTAETRRKPVETRRNP